MTKALWTVAEVARALGLAGDYPETPIDLVTQDSRAVKPGSLFVALSGTPSGGFVSSFASSRDGWEFAANAEQAGAVAMIVPHRVDGISVPQLVVPDTLIDGLWALARAARARFHGPVIGLTGSAGKTSTKEFIATYPGASASPSSFNNFWGVPLTLCNADPSASVWVVEMGMNQQGEIARLTELSQPTVALVVNVQPVHLEKLGSLEAIRKEKVSIARGLPSDGILVLPVDLAAPEWPGRVLRFGAGADVHAMSKVPAGESWDVTADIAGRHLAFSLTPGAPHRLHNALAALASVAAAGLDPVLLARELGEVGIMTGRGVEQRIGEIVLIDDSFNGNPASMAAALDSLQARPVRGRRIAVIGDMLELGDEAPAYHADMVGHVTGIDGVYCVGPLMRHLFEKLPPEKRLGWHEDPATLDASQVAALLAPDDVVVIKGSKKIFWVNKFVQKLAAALQASN
ncbi:MULTISPECIES: UDP-N-acetylmuramoyl-tripeptide--D-alanyl-D-alanine ligase [Bradyrhizobium]|jgi:UDP-N-acetylmuramoyl-tripeptide--D-alanyl-D-alanine ligase|uniref:UDP-N-acetylmuramoyl-tripeptide--D-alanyl-D-alanine ligase n=4 Tax=Pseudomonadota TaxID=1224 RepID=A0ABS5GGE0_9BRAD|nr:MULTISPECIES: UDP-N-acetylmuramoyl-tripeptide--D-alanyl-D-alanine ligase [Bradyrhizobium]MBR1139681.1 UDP-N-acetylmuramoyl-tripeptide--D-alanyl-D-alanine ligase [Bradyrhizobium denitrificans]MDU1491342.1 UDP-N-acetylmuramoyl-tripeptide--D-alanyl-D-alanine ligase [Bradyrhizobium sp.]MDU1541520.1 UDP-N-acetylmuramoyl-tripeptide--D-alanyl-D-alanine ligase [Bradyrhizobium sp.]MDU1804451.1 UDP-N-acetylmuramoyl-tripeptide--D-alanyl-D-alanine ligase [Bradyrhizobium sp.]MDU3046262.1 UDP-N-acetylmur